MAASSNSMPGLILPRAPVSTAGSALVTKMPPISFAAMTYVPSDRAATARAKTTDRNSRIPLSARNPRTITDVSHIYDVNRYEVKTDDPIWAIDALQREQRVRTALPRATGRSLNGPPELQQGALVAKLQTERSMPRQPTSVVECPLLQEVMMRVGTDLQPSRIPESFYVTQPAPMGVDLEERTYGTARALLHTTVFPSKQPSGRMEVVHLANTMSAMLGQVAVLKQTEPTAATAADIDSDLVLASSLDHEASVLDIILSEVIRQVQLHCTERGLLLEAVRQRYRELFQSVHSTVEKASAHVEAAQRFGAKCQREVRESKEKMQALQEEHEKVHKVEMKKLHDRAQDLESQLVQEKKTRWSAQEDNWKMAQQLHAYLEEEQTRVRVQLQKEHNEEMARLEQDLKDPENPQEHTGDGGDGGDGEEDDAMEDMEIKLQHQANKSRLDSDSGEASRTQTKSAMMFVSFARMAMKETKLLAEERKHNEDVEHNMHMVLDVVSRLTELQPVVEQLESKLGDEARKRKASVIEVNKRPNTMAAIYGEMQKLVGEREGADEMMRMRRYSELVGLVPDTISRLYERLAALEHNLAINKKWDSVVNNTLKLLKGIKRNKEATDENIPKAVAHPIAAKLTPTQRVFHPKNSYLWERAGVEIKARGAGFFLKTSREIYKGKLASDACSDRDGTPRVSFPEYAIQWTKEKYGAKPLVDQHLSTLIVTAAELRSTSRDADIFCNFLEERWDLHCLDTFLRAEVLCEDVRAGVGMMYVLKSGDVKSENWVCTKRLEAIIGGVLGSVSSQSMKLIIEACMKQAVSISGPDLLNEMKQLPAVLREAVRQYMKDFLPYLAHVHSGDAPPAGVLLTFDAQRPEFYRIKRVELQWLLCRVSAFFHDGFQQHIVKMYSVGDLNHDALMDRDEFQQLMVKVQSEFPDSKRLHIRQMWDEMRLKCPFLRDDLVEFEAFRTVMQSTDAIVLNYMHSAIVPAHVLDYSRNDSQELLDAVRDRWQGIRPFFESCVESIQKEVKRRQSLAPQSVPISRVATATALAVPTMGDKRVSITQLVQQRDRDRDSRRLSVAPRRGSVMPDDSGDRRSSFARRGSAMMEEGGGPMRRGSIASGAIPLARGMSGIFGAQPEHKWEFDLDDWLLQVHDIKSKLDQAVISADDAKALAVYRRAMVILAAGLMETWASRLQTAVKTVTQMELDVVSIETLVKYFHTRVIEVGGVAA
eukprot:TRINITY_DN13422_c0_g1_i1.p1 TRINITY_DN13422_c0_g1~~TRINITY_DN13422_c0_g1_i1.p1  ORF type:complete len:1220 (-),score=266.69 TRINITY_DN13422_c0_g1_i1:35-3694(-)